MATRKRKAMGTATTSQAGRKRAPRTERTRAVEVGGDPWIPSGEAIGEDLGPYAPTVARFGDEDSDPAVSGVMAAGESDREAGVSAAPEYDSREVDPEIGVDTTFSIDTVGIDDNGDEFATEPRRPSRGKHSSRMPHP